MFSMSHLRDKLEVSPKILTTAYVLLGNTKVSTFTPSSYHLYSAYTWCFGNYGYSRELLVYINLRELVLLFNAVALPQQFLEFMPNMILSGAHR